MCRWLAYSGEPLFIEDLVTQPTHSLVKQSLNTQMNYTPEGNLWHTNGDGFGIGWYSQKEEPGLFKDERPAWNDVNLHEISSQIRTRAFLAHIRAATTAEVQRTNCHPFKYKKWLFQHNGHVSDFYQLRRDLQMEIAPELYPELKGNTDSETIFLLALTYGLQTNPKRALQKVVKRIRIASRKHNASGQINLSCAFCDGDKLYTLRYAEKEEAMSQFYSSNLRSILDLQNKGDALPIKSVVVVSEPLNRLSELWEEVPENSFTTIENGKVKVEDFMEADILVPQ